MDAGSIDAVTSPRVDENARCVRKSNWTTSPAVRNALYDRKNDGSSVLFRNRTLVQPTGPAVTTNDAIGTRLAVPLAATVCDWKVPAPNAWARGVLAYFRGS